MSWLRTRSHPAAGGSPILLKKLIVETGINQSEMATACGCNRSTMNITVNSGYIPKRIKNYKENIEKYINKNRAAMLWLERQGLNLPDIWKQLEDGEIYRKTLPRGTTKKIRQSRINKAMQPGNPVEIQTTEVEMIRSEALKHFKLFRNPFIDDIQNDRDIFMSDEHRYIESAMLDAANHSGFLAVIGEVGSGKSVMRRKVIETLKRDEKVIVIYPQIVDKTRVTAASICDAIVMDISSEKPRMKLEQKTRQVQSLLLDRSKSGFRACLIIEEAHDLAPKTLKYLKRFYELEDGYKKLLGIILIGQTELRHMFNESMHVDMREVIRRCQVAEITGLNGSTRNYLEKKFSRINRPLKEIIEDDAIEALTERLTTKDRQGNTISHAYPLNVNNHMARAMNLAADMGESIITKDIILAM